MVHGIHPVGVVRSAWPSIPPGITLIRLGSPRYSSISDPPQLCCLSRTVVPFRTGPTPLRARQVLIVTSQLQSLINVHVSSTSHPSRRAYRLLISSRGRSSRHYHTALVHLLCRRCMSNSAHTLPQSTLPVTLPHTKPTSPPTQNPQR